MTNEEYRDSSLNPLDFPNLNAGKKVGAKVFL
jgi:hypothetical protein